ncbi:uncharacterized protein LOC123271638 [Cotesia glomerata]|uniref:uncharacterized protein LOC123271638 n=1 Tax=Cotesia glomerata TaxID=32391 RepID=UPI001D020FB3|nr:uncharacterized protein LOC123271638 [Cotesia glomerata]
MKIYLLFLFVALFATSSNCQFSWYQYPALGMQAPPVGPPVGPPGQLNIQQTYENYNNNPGNPGNQYPGFSRDPFYNPNFQKDPSVPEKKTYKNYNMEANYHVNSNDDPSLIKKPFKSYQASVTVSHFKNEKTYSYGDN